MDTNMIKANQKAVADSTASEHAAIVAIQQKFEAALASPAPGREREWAARVATELRQLYDLMRAHCQSAEAPSGLLKSIEETTLIVNERLVGVREHHQKILDECQALLPEVERCASGEAVSYAALRRRAASLTIEMRHHLALEADLVFEAFESEIGVID
jgi:hypothetical protein